MLELILSFLIPIDKLKHENDSMFSKTERFFSTDGVSQRNKSKFDKFIEDQQRLYSSCSHILSRDDEMSIKFRAYQKTVKWISQTGQLLDLYVWSNFQDEYDSFYSFNNIDFSNRFTYTKAD